MYPFSNQQVGAINTGGGLFSNPVTKIEGAFLETEGFGSKVLSVKENTQNVVAGIFQVYYTFVPSCKK